MIQPRTGILRRCKKNEEALTRNFKKQGAEQCIQYITISVFKCWAGTEIPFHLNTQRCYLDDWGQSGGDFSQDALCTF